MQGHLLSWLGKRHASVGSPGLASPRTWGKTGRDHHRAQVIPEQAKSRETGAQGRPSQCTCAGRSLPSPVINQRLPVAQGVVSG
jgi:hypothetical protein